MYDEYVHCPDCGHSYAENAIYHAHYTSVKLLNRFHCLSQHHTACHGGSVSVPQKHHHAPVHSDNCISFAVSKGLLEEPRL